MKVTRLKSGYVIRLTDSEWSILSGMESFMTAGDMTEEMEYWPAPQKAAWTRRMKHHEFFLGIDQDKR